MIKKILVSTLLCLPLCAQGPVLPLSLKQAVDLALTPQGSTRVQFAQELIQQAEARRKQALGALLPNVDGYMSAQDQTRNLAALGIHVSIPIPGFSFPTFVGPFSYVDARATASQSVFDFSAIRRYQAARSGIEVARAEDENTRNQVSDQVARAYLAALRAQVVAETAAANVELADRLRRLAGSQKEAGTGTGIEITRAQVQLANERQRQIVAENDLDRARLQLMRAMGLDLQTKIQLTDTLKFAAVEATDPQKAVEVALAKRPDLKSQRKREDNARLSYSAV
jgi:outer membrane protein TolC